MPAQQTSAVNPQPSIVLRSPVFYGWVVWFVSTLGIIATAPGQSFSVSLFIDKFIEDFDMSRTTVSGLYGLGTFIAALSLTWVGKRIDLHGNRRVGVIVGALFALALVGMSTINGSVMLLIGFIAIRGLGQGSLGLVSSTSIAQWFHKRRGRVMSISLVVFSLFQGIYVPWLERLLEDYNWRSVWILLGVGVALITIPVYWLLMRNRPEDFGLMPDGGVINKETTEIVFEEHWTLREAQRTRLFWIYLYGRMISPAWGTGLIFHQVSIFGALGYERRVAADVFGIIALITAVFSLGSGFLLDRYSAGKVMSLQLIGLVVSMAFAMFMTQTWMLVIYAIAFGLVMGMGAVFDGSVWANLFGRANQGVIRGFVTTALVVGTSIGPITFGLSYDLTGSYNAVLVLGIVLTIIPVVMAPLVKLPSLASLRD